MLFFVRSLNSWIMACLRKFAVNSGAIINYYTCMNYSDVVFFRSSKDHAETIFINGHGCRYILVYTIRYNR